MAHFHPFRFFRNQFLLLDLLHLQLERSLCTAGTPPSFDWVAPHHLETCHWPHYNEFIHSLHHAILYMQNLDRTMWVAGGIGGGSRRWYKWVSPATVSKHIVHPSCKKYAYIQVSTCESLVSQQFFWNFTSRSLKMNRPCHRQQTYCPPFLQEICIYKSRRCD